MTQTVFSATPGDVAFANLNWTQLYDLRDHVSTPSYVAGTPWATFDASGNIGLGAAPNASWKLDINNGTLGGLANIAGFSDSGVYTIWGGRSAVNGGFVQLYGGSHASSANVITFGTNSLARMQIDASGNVTVVAASLGYGTGSGGTVTQATSKSTGVTLNKSNGQITMNGAALVNGTVVSFTLTNSTIAATDVPHVAIASAATAGAYGVQVDAVAAGSCRISVRNNSGGSLSEALVLNFANLKAVNA